MHKIIFYEKPGCADNTRKKNHLKNSGYIVEARDLTRERWTSAGLRAFFAEKPVKDWFDPSAPRVVSGEINPAAINPQAALVMMSVDPSLIRSPLVKFHGHCGAGLDELELDAFLASAAHAKARQKPRPAM